MAIMGDLRNIDSLAKLDIDDILENPVSKDSLVHQGFIYFLIKDREIVYVGQTVNLISRISTHVKEKDFDSYNFIETNDMDRMELVYIIKFKPKLNIKMPANKRYKKLSAIIWRPDLEKYTDRIINEAKIKPVFRDYFDVYEVNRFFKSQKKYIENIRDLELAVN